MTLVNVKHQPTHSFNNFVDDFFKGIPSLFRDDFNNHTFKHFVPVNVIESESAFKLEVVAPGFDKEDIKIDLDKNILTISAERRAEETKTEKDIRKEYAFQSFKRSFTVSKQIDTQNIEAKYVNGVLTVSLPKKAEVKEPVKNITVN